MMPEANSAGDMEAEGLPSLEDRPPGIDIETDSEGLVVPRDHPIAVGTDPAYPVTEAEQRQTETVAERAAREIPDVGAELGVGGGAGEGEPAPQEIGGPDTTVLGAFSNHAGPDVLATAVEADGPLGRSLADDDAVAPIDTVRFFAPDSGDGIDFDDESQAVAYEAEATDDGISVEEAAVHVVDELS